MKKTIKSSMPSITLGTQYTPIESVSAAAATSGNVNNALLLTAIAPSKSSDSKKSSIIPQMTVIPASVSITSLGMPDIYRGQQFFLDLGTNTTADNVYAVSNVTHSISSGKFTTRMDLKYVGTASAKSGSMVIKNLIKSLEEVSTKLETDIGVSQLEEMKLE